jgi:hypothetical protein
MHQETHRPRRRSIKIRSRKQKYRHIKSSGLLHVNNYEPVILRNRARKSYLSPVIIPGMHRAGHAGTCITDRTVAPPFHLRWPCCSQSDNQFPDMSGRSELQTVRYWRWKGRPYRGKLSGDVREYCFPQEDLEEFRGFLVFYAHYGGKQ